MDTRSRKERIRDLATRQFWLVTWAQLAQINVPSVMLQSWLRSGYASRVAPRVYAIGHDAPSRERELWAAVLYAGPEAAISHATAAQWLGLIKYAPHDIEVSTPRTRIAPLPGVHVHTRRMRQRFIHNGVPVTTVPQTLLDLAATSELRLVRRALAQLDFRKQLDVEVIEAACGHGRAGTRRLRQALEAHQPRLAHTNEELEARFVEWCERRSIELPKCNVYVHGVLVDAYWERLGLVVELDGDANHSSAAQRRRDRRNELTLRTYGVTVIRYDWSLVTGDDEAMYADLTDRMKECELRARPPASRPLRLRSAAAGS